MFLKLAFNRKYRETKSFHITLWFTRKMGCDYNILSSLLIGISLFYFLVTEFTLAIANSG